MMSSAAELNALKFRLKQQAVRLGFDACGVARATFLEQEAQYLEQWLKRNAHGEMAYMANYFDKRTDPRKLVDGAQTVVSVLKIIRRHQRQLCMKTRQKSRNTPGAKTITGWLNGSCTSCWNGYKMSLARSLGALLWTPHR